MLLLNQSLPKSAPRHKRLHLAVSAIKTCSRKISETGACTAKSTRRASSADTETCRKATGSPTKKAALKAKP